MEFAKKEIEAVEVAINKLDEIIVELGELDLAIVGGGSGAVSLG